MGASGVFWAKAEPWAISQAGASAARRSARARTRRDLPMPASPAISTAWPDPERARRKRSRRICISASRLTRGGSRTSSRLPGSTEEPSSYTLDRGVEVLQVDGGQRPGGEPPPEELAARRAHPDLAGRHLGLDGHGDVEGVAGLERRAGGRAGHHHGGPGVHARAHGQPVSGGDRQGGEALLEQPRRPHGPLGVVLVRPRIAEAEPEHAVEHGAQRARELPADLPPQALEGGRGLGEEPRDRARPSPWKAGRVGPARSRRS